MLLSIALIVIAGYAGICVFAYINQRALLFPRMGDIWRDPSDAGWKFEDVWLEHPMGKSHAWYIRADASRGTVLFSHGNAGTIADRLESIEDFIVLGFDVLIYDYGGYGKSDGEPSEDRCYADIKAAWNYLVNDRGVAPSEIVLFGRSLGSGPTSWLAVDIEPAAVIFESAFTSAPEMAQEAFPFLPAKWLMRDRFDNVGRIAKITAPLLVIHSREDDIIPFRHGEKLFAAANEPKQFLEIHGSHNDGWYVSREMYRGALSDFLTGMSE